MKLGLVQGVVSAEAFMLHGEKIYAANRKRPPRSDHVRRRRFVANFGTTPEICSNVWARICFERKADMPSRSSPKHLLWALYLMKVYATEDVLAGDCGVDEKTFRKWSWMFIEEIAKMAKSEVSF